MTGPARPDKGPRRELGLAVVLTVVAGALLLFVAGRGWVSLRVDRSAPLPPLRRTVDGSAAQPLLSALGLVGLAGAVAIVATRRIGRVVIGVLLCAAGVLTVQRVVTDLNGMSGGHVLSLLEDAGPVIGVDAGARTSVDLQLTWMVCAVVAGLLLTGAGALTILRCRRWPVMGRRYERAHARRESAAGRSVQSDRSLWDALDRGDDPTAADNPADAAPAARKPGAGSNDAGE